MSTAMVASEAKAVPRVVSSIQDIPLAEIRESKTNRDGCVLLVLEPEVNYRPLFRLYGNSLAEGAVSWFFYYNLICSRWDFRK